MSKGTTKKSNNNDDVKKEVANMAQEAKDIKKEVEGTETKEHVAPAQEETMIHIVGPFYRTKKVKAEKEEKESLLKKVGKPVALVGAGIGVGFGIAKAIAGIEDDGEEVNDTE